MKIRNGFVSNSSSSSFVMIGVAIEDAENIERQIMEMLGYDFTADIAKFRNQYYPNEEIDDEMISEFFYKDVEDNILEPLGLKVVKKYDAECLIGKLITKTENYGLANSGLVNFGYSINELNEIGDLLKKILGQDIEVKLYCGTEMC